MKTIHKTAWTLSLASLLTVISGCNPIQDTKLAQATSTQFLTRMQAHQYQQAYKLLSTQCQAVTNLQQMKQYWTMVETGKGKVKTWSQTGFNVSSFNLKTTVTLSYKLQCAKGTSNITFAVTPENEKWTIQGFNVNL